MSWLGLLLLGIGITDAAFSLLGPPSPRTARLAEAVGASGALIVGLLAGLTAVGEIVSLLVLAALVVAWGESVTFAFARSRYAVPLAVLAATVAVALLAAGAAPRAGGLLADWLDASPYPVLGGLEPDRALLLAGVLVVQLSTGNVVVRLVLGVTGTSHPLRGAGQNPPSPLKGGRLLGPMERLVIVGLGVAGQVTAVSVVVAAKGLLRFPELQSAGGERIHEVTEYFLVGSFVSWLMAFGCLVLVAT